MRLGGFKVRMLFLSGCALRVLADDRALMGWIDPNVMRINIEEQGKPYAVFSEKNGIYRVEFGRFDSPCPPIIHEGDNCSRPGMEPRAHYYVQYKVYTRGGGYLTFKHRLQSYDTYKNPSNSNSQQTDAAGLSIWDASGNDIIIEPSPWQSPNSKKGQYWDSGVKTFVYDLEHWKYEDDSVALVSFSLYTDGHGDQSKLEIFDLQVVGCDLIPVMPLTDVEAIAFENGNPINTEKLNNRAKQGLECMTKSVADLGGRFHLSSAYRPMSYQAHLMDVWLKSEGVDQRKQPQIYCASLEKEIASEMSKHMLVTKPAGAVQSAPHSSGNAFDATISGLPSPHTVDSLAKACGMYRRMPVQDPVHYEPVKNLFDSIGEFFHG